MFKQLIQAVTWRNIFIRGLLKVFSLIYPTLKQESNLRTQSQYTFFCLFVFKRVSTCTSGREGWREERESCTLFLKKKLLTFRELKD